MRSIPDTLRAPVRSCPSRLACGLGAAHPSAWPLLYSGLPVPVHSARRWRSSRVSRLPLCVHAPFADSGGVLSTRHCVSRTSAFRQHKNVGFPPTRAGVSSRTTTIQFSELSHAACTLATPGFTHTLTGLCMQVHFRFGGSPPLMGLVRHAVLTHWVTATNFTASFPIPRF